MLINYQMVTIMRELKQHKNINDKWYVCRECGCRMKSGEALQNTPCVGISDFPGQTDLRGQTMTMTGPPKMVNVWKCEYCGHSISAA